MLDSNSSGLAHFSQNAVLILLSILLLPSDTLILAYGLIARLVLRPDVERRCNRASSSFSPKTILITGVGMSKGLALARTFYQAGHRVIGADFETDGVPVNGRCSRAVARFYRLTTPTDKSGIRPYLQELYSIITTEKVDLWVSCSSVGSATEDGEVKDMIAKQTNCKAIQFDADLTRTLHEKHSFIGHTVSLGLTAPETHQIVTRATVHQLLEQAGEKRFIMKSVGMDDLSRGDLTLLPRPTISETYQHLAGMQISLNHPWVLQQFIVGEEYCTHALVIDNEVKVFVACPSSELLMHYKGLDPESALSQAMLEYTRQYVARTEGRMTGHLSFDFLVKDVKTARGVERILYPIECNPRAHTAVVLLEGMGSAMADAYLSQLDQQTNTTNGLIGQVVMPRQTTQYYWVGHDLVTLVLYPIFRLLTRSAEVTELGRGLAVFTEHLLFWKDGTFEIWDPLPWWWLYHVYWPGKFLMAIVKQRWWSRCNVSTTKMFAC